MPRLYVENGRDRGKSYEIDGDGPFLAGRDPAVQIPLPDELVSRRHFQIERHHKVHHISDLGSGNGTFLNGHRVRKPEPRCQDIEKMTPDALGAYRHIIANEKEPPIVPMPFGVNVTSTMSQPLISLGAVARLVNEPLPFDMT